MTYTVALADYDDLKWIVDEAASMMLSEEVGNNQLYHKLTITNLVLNALATETLFIAKKDEKPVGVIGGVLVPHYLNADKKTLAEIMWYVLPDHRKGRAAFLLLDIYSKKAKEVADLATFSLLATSPISDRTLERFGFKPKERSFIMEN